MDRIFLRPEGGVMKINKLEQLAGLNITNEKAFKEVSHEI